MERDTGAEIQAVLSNLKSLLEILSPKERGGFREEIDIAFQEAVDPLPDHCFFCCCGTEFHLFRAPGSSLVITSYPREDFVEHLCFCGRSFWANTSEVINRDAVREEEMHYYNEME